jgi:hypothetical protein
MTRAGKSRSEVASTVGSFKKTYEQVNVNPRIAKYLHDKN